MNLINKEEINMLNEKTEIRLSKFMTKLLRHDPKAFGLILDPTDGSCELKDMMRAIRSQSRWASITLQDVEQVVRNSDKQRFEIANGRIRARYGHSYEKIRYEPGDPPETLYHGTNRHAAPAILREGIRPMGRQYVHLSEGLQFATLAGSRRGELVILRVDTAKARSMGVTFYFAGNEVWLADEVPASCCTIDDGKGANKR